LDNINLDTSLVRELFQLLQAFQVGDKFRNFLSAHQIINLDLLPEMTDFRLDQVFKYRPPSTGPYDPFLFVSPMCFQV
jgi:hypothetical protein